MAGVATSAASRLTSTLGGRRALGIRVETVDGLRERVRAGLPYASLAAVGEAYGIELRALSRILAIPERTLARRKRERRLKPDESDRVLRVARVAAMAEEALGGREQAVRWLHRPNRGLGNAVPLEQLDTEIGARQVEDLLGRIAHGIHS